MPTMLIVIENVVLSNVLVNRKNGAPSVDNRIVEIMANIEGNER
jgi:hypothetical protein